jgi:hypothetical protein
MFQTNFLLLTFVISRPQPKFIYPAQAEGLFPLGRPACHWLLLRH